MDHTRYRLGARDDETKKSHEYVLRGSHAKAPEFFGPRNDFEAGVLQIFRDLFGLEILGIYHNFFHMGDDSLLAVQRVRRLHERFGVQLPLRAIWDVTNTAETPGPRPSWPRSRPSRSRPDKR